MIVPDFTMIASAAAVSHCGATPVFVDASEKSFNINPAKIEEKITPRTKAIDVMRIGLRRVLAAATAASKRVCPASSACFANSTMRIAFLAARPTSTTSPISTRMLRSSPRRLTPIMAAKMHIGTMRITASGSSQLS